MKKPPFLRTVSLEPLDDLKAVIIEASDILLRLPPITALDEGFKELGSFHRAYSRAVITLVSLDGSAAAHEEMHRCYSLIRALAETLLSGQHLDHDRVDELRDNHIELKKTLV